MGYNKGKNNPNFKYNITKQFLVKEYIVNKKSMPQIAKLIGCSWMNIKRYLLKYNIRIRTYKEINLGKNNGIWQGDNVSYNALHGWVRRHLPKPKNCPKCNKRLVYDLSNKSGKYLRDLSDFEWLCRKCHMLSDKRLEKLKQCRILDIGINKRILKQEYIDNHKSTTELANEFKCSRSCIRNRLIKYNIPRRTISESLAGKNHPMYNKHLSITTRRKISNSLKSKERKTV